jgi:spermidine synthase
MPQDPVAEPRFLHPVFFALFFVSGMSGLIFEIVWIRALGVQFGTTAPAVATVLAAFMAGLALGNLIFGPVADRHRRPLELYGRLEVGIAVSGLAVTLFLLNGDVALGAIARVLADAGAARTPLRFLLFFSLLLLPTTLMGGTLPVLSRALASRGMEGRVVGALYAINTAGAVVGALVPDLLLVPIVGLTSTAGAASLGNLAVALGVGYLAKRGVDVPPLGVESGRTPRLPLVLFGVSGFCAMGYELLWSRAIQHWAWGDVASFSVLLAVYLVFISLGAVVASSRADSVRRPIVWAAWLLVLAGASVVVTLGFADDAHRAVGRLLPFGGVVRPAPGTALARAALLSTYLEAPACLLMGAAFPFLAAASVRAGEVGRRTGLLYAVNTLAGVAGSVVTCFWLMPTFGVQNTLLGLAVALAMTGAAVLAALPGGVTARWMPLGVAVACAAGGLAIPADHLRHTYFDVSQDDIIELREGSTTTAAVIRRTNSGLETYLALATPGVFMSSTGFAAQRYMSLMGQVPLLFSKERSEALLICYGAGNTARALLASPGLKRLDVVDISPEVLQLSHRFAPAHGGDPLLDPRAHAWINDGRQHLLTTDQRYDVITLEPPPPTHAGVVNLYSREYYVAARGALKEGGVLAQWLPVFQLAPRETLAIIAALVAEFPHTAMFQGVGHQWFLLGSSAPLSVDVAAWREHLSQPSVAAELERIGTRADVASILATFMVGDATLREAAAHGRAVTDDFPSLQYPSGALTARVEYPALLASRPQDVLDLVPGGWDGLGGPLEQERARRAFAVSEAMFAALDYQSLGVAEERDLFYGSRVRRALALDPDAVFPWRLLGVGPGSVAEAERRLESGSAPEASLLLVRRMFYEGRWEDVLASLAEVDPKALGEAHVWLLRGAAERGLGRREDAVDSFEQAREGGSGMFRGALRRLQEATSAHDWPSDAGPLSAQRPPPGDLGGSRATRAERAHRGTSGAVR